MNNSIFDKSDKGREEIATRKYHLAPRLRTLLVLMDGKHSIADLLQKVSGLGLNTQSAEELLENGYIHSVTTQHVDNPPHMNEPDFECGATGLPANDATTSAEHAHSQDDTLGNGESQIEALHHFFNETIKSTIGLRGIPLQFKVERANSLAEFRDLKQTYLDAVFKAKGNEIMLSMRDRLDLLLAMEQSVPGKVD
jgi:hypothetical protein